jgi:LmbE family N-acetylglucosaminyl deacetylase
MMNFEDKKILIIVAHPDDEVLGCGGIISKFYSRAQFKIIYIAEGTSVRFQTREDPSISYEIEKRNAGSLVLERFGIKDLSFYNLPCGNLINVDPKIIHDVVNQSVSDFSPDIVITHSKYDNHQDHRVVYEAALVSLRPIEDLRRIAILSFEALSSTEWNFEQPFIPNLFVNLSPEDLANKIEMLEAYSTEIRDYPFPRSSEGIRALASYRGIQSGFTAAEAFKIIRTPII